MAHIHHIIPQYQGGTDDLSNLIEVSVTRHAMFHFCNWQLWRRKEDWIAWKGLSKQIGEEEIFIEASSLGGRSNTGKPKSYGHRTKISLSVKENHSKHPRSKETKQKISMALRGNQNSHSQKSGEARKKHSEIMKAAWAQRKINSGT